MTPRRRIALAAVLAVLAVSVVGALSSLMTITPRDERQMESSVVPRRDPEIPEAPATVAEPPVQEPEPEEERPIEEILSESGEDPGAVFYMSRVREAMREGNPGFARELLRQMKEEHSASVLIEEAEAVARER